jgi:hypothetical protein
MQKKSNSYIFFVLPLLFVFFKNNRRMTEEQNGGCLRDRLPPSALPAMQLAPDQPSANFSGPGIELGSACECSFPFSSTYSLFIE